VSVKDELNTDGIRPDVADEIKRAFPDSERKRAAATQLARAFQMALTNPEAAMAVNTTYERAQSCLDAIEGLRPEDGPTETGDKIEGWVVNSAKRSRAYLRYNAGLSGQVFDGPEADLKACDFDPAKMRN
jgi:hypothetical protein